MDGKPPVVIVFHWTLKRSYATFQVEDLARLSFQKTPVYIDVDDGRKRVTKSLLSFQFFHDMFDFTKGNRLHLVKDYI